VDQIILDLLPVYQFEYHPLWQPEYLHHCSQYMFHALIGTVSFLEAVVVILNKAKLKVQTANMNMYIIS
jgi:hypothetical protein